MPVTPVLVRLLIALTDARQNNSMEGVFICALKLSVHLGWAGRRGNTEVYMVRTRQQYFLSWAPLPTFYHLPAVP